MPSNIVIATLAAIVAVLGAIAFVSAQSGGGAHCEGSRVGA